MKRKLYVIVSVLLVISMVVFTGCGGGSSEPSGSGDAVTSGGETILRGTCTATPDTMDPARGSGENDNLVFVNLYETLVVPNDVDASPEALLASEWTTSDDGKVWTFKLRENVMFSDGAPFNADDVKYSMDRMIAIGEGFAFIFKDIIDQVNVIDDYTVEFVLTDPFGPFLSTLTCFRIVNRELMEANTLPDGIYGENGDYGTEYLLTNSAGSGPYVVDEFEIRESIRLKKNPNYWNEIPEKAPDKVLITQLLEASTTKMLMANGDVDMVHGRQEDVTLQELLRNDGVKTGSLPEFGLNYFMMNTKKAPTDDVHIRKAISYAANYDQMKELYGGMPDAIGPVPPGLWGASSNFDTYDYNMEKAKEEIALSKYADSLQNYPIELAYIQGNGDTDKLTMLLANDLQAIGFNVEINEVPWVLFCNNAQSIETSPNITNLFCSANYPEAGSILEFKYASWATGDWNQNEWLLDDKFDSMLLEAVSTIDDDERLKMYEDIQKYLVDDVVPSLYTFVNVLKPAWNSDTFTWRVDEGKTHSIYEYNYCYVGFEMK